MTSMPVVFVGHGNPMNVLRSNQWTKGWAALGKSMPKPKAILAGDVVRFPVDGFDGGSMSMLAVELSQSA